MFGYFKKNCSLHQNMHTNMWNKILKIEKDWKLCRISTNEVPKINNYKVWNKNNKFSKLTLNFEIITYGKWEQTFQNHIAMYKAK